MRFAYADPPYIGQAKRHYGNQPDYAGEVDYRALIARLGEYDGWALSCSSPSLRILLPLCPDTTRVMAWVKPFASWKPGINPTYAWEPVLVYGGRRLGRFEDTVRDWVAASITLKRGLVGVKPDAFCFWLFGVLGMQANDRFDDLFPGSGAVTRAWESWQRQLLRSNETPDAALDAEVQGSLGL